MLFGSQAAATHVQIRDIVLWQMLVAKKTYRACGYMYNDMGP